jgi:hypothetical protein
MLELMKINKVFFIVLVIAFCMEVLVAGRRKHRWQQGPPPAQQENQSVPISPERSEGKRGHHGPWQDGRKKGGLDRHRQEHHEGKGHEPQEPVQEKVPIHPPHHFQGVHPEGKPHHGHKGPGHGWRHPHGPEHSEDESEQEPQVPDKGHQGHPGHPGGERIPHEWGGRKGGPHGRGHGGGRHRHERSEETVDDLQEKITRLEAMKQQIQARMALPQGRSDRQHNQFKRKHGDPQQIILNIEKEIAACNEKLESLQKPPELATLLKKTQESVGIFQGKLVELKTAIEKLKQALE